MKISVVGAGAWGTALAMVCRRSNRDILIYTRNEEVLSSINNDHENKIYLPSVAIDEPITAVSDLPEIVGSDLLVLVVPSQVLGSVCQQIKDEGLPADIPLIICCKGIEQETQKLMHEVVLDILPENPLAILSGPNFADEVAKGLPAATTIASDQDVFNSCLKDVFSDPTFRAYHSPDIIGAQIGGAVKNVLAIACGIAAGRGFGENAKAALITRGVAEIGRLSVAKGGRSETLMGLSGIGDIMLTCGSLKSRNMSLGYELGQGKALEDILAERKAVTEGVVTAKSVFELASGLDVEMPICNAVYSILHQGADIESVIKNLLSRPVAGE